MSHNAFVFLSGNRSLELAAEEPADDSASDSQSAGSSSSDSPIVATGKQLAPEASRCFKVGSVAYMWYDVDENGLSVKRVVKGKVVGLGKLQKGQTKWDRVHDVEFGKDDGDGTFPIKYGDLFSKKRECSEAYSGYLEDSD